MLQRIYGTAFADKKQLAEYLKQREEAEKRDHRKLGKELGLFTFHPLRAGRGVLAAQGHRRSTRRCTSSCAALLLDDAGYVEVKTPLSINQELWESRATGSTTRRTCSRSSPRSRRSASSR